MAIQNTDSSSQKRHSNIQASERKLFIDQMETALDIGCVLDLLGKAPGENAVFSTFTAQNILLPKNLILTTSLVYF